MEARTVDGEIARLEGTIEESILKGEFDDGRRMEAARLPPSRPSRTTSLPAWRGTHSEPASAPTTSSSSAQHSAMGARVPRDGFSHLVDHGDRSMGALPNCLATCFGHGVYTSYDAMLLTVRLLADHFYR